MLRLSSSSTLFPYTTLFRSTRHFDFGDDGDVAFRRVGDDFADIVLRVKATVTAIGAVSGRRFRRSEEHTSELQSRFDLVCRLLLEKKKVMILNLRPLTAPND